MQIWIVEGSCGEYDDRQNWKVAVYNNEPGAKARCELCLDSYNEILNAAGKELLAKNPKISTRGQRYQVSSMLREAKEELGPFDWDPMFETDFSGTYYAVSGPYEVEE